MSSVPFRRNSGHIMLLTCGSRPDDAITRQTVVDIHSEARRSWQPSQPTPMGEAPMKIDAVSGNKGKMG